MNTNRKQPGMAAIVANAVMCAVVLWGLALVVAMLLSLATIIYRSRI